MNGMYGKRYYTSKPWVVCFTDGRFVATTREKAQRDHLRIRGSYWNEMDALLVASISNPREAAK